MATLLITVIALAILLIEVVVGILIGRRRCLD